jgi:hypothetical protein
MNINPTILRTSNGRHFDPANLDDLNEYKYFMTTGRWRTPCPFFTEEPYNNVISMIERKIAKHWIDAMVLALTDTRPRRKQHDLS